MPWTRGGLTLALWFIGASTVTMRRDAETEVQGVSVRSRVHTGASVGSTVDDRDLSDLLGEFPIGEFNYSTL